MLTLSKPAERRAMEMMKQQVRTVQHEMLPYLSVRQQQILFEIWQMVHRVPESETEKKRYFSKLFDKMRQIDQLQGDEYKTGIGNQLFEIFNEVRVYQDLLNQKAIYQRTFIRKAKKEDKLLPIEIKKQLYPYPEEHLLRRQKRATITLNYES